MNTSEYVVYFLPDGKLKFYSATNDLEAAKDMARKIKGYVTLNGTLVFDSARE